ncbi:13231_t:CDS:2, partial [Ambispora leptoticha]
LPEKANLNDKELAKKIKTDSYFCEKLTKFHNSPPDSAAGKVWQVFIKHGIPLDKYYNYIENNQEKKRQQKINPETRQPWDPPLTEQQRKIIQDPILTSPGTRPFHPPKREDLENPHYSVPDITVDTISKVLECFSYLQKAQEQIEECLTKNSF